ELAKINELKSRLANLIELVETGGNTPTAVARTIDLQRQIDEHEALLGQAEIESNTQSAMVNRDTGALFMKLQAQLRHAKEEDQASIRADISQRLRGFVEKII